MRWGCCLSALLYLPPGTRADLFHARRQLKGAAKSLQNAKGGLDERRSERVTQMQKELAALLARVDTLNFTPATRRSMT